MHEGDGDVRNDKAALAANRELDQQIRDSAAVISLRPPTGPYVEIDSDGGVVWRRLDDNTDL